ncbi:MAG: hypothetical protein LBQ11_01740 [Candidatus Nomurabacteria bacterium]|jgi:hypothetical protein|nr:hypothetical protein [Candidatus Nomurabacteria bacterium]
MEFENSNDVLELDQIRHEIIALNEEEISDYITERKRKLSENSISGGGYNKQASKGTVREAFFSEDEIIYPGHNKAGFRIDDDSLYEVTVREVKEIEDEDWHGLESVIWVMHSVLSEYFSLMDLKCQNLKNKKIRKQKFYEPNNTIYSISNLRNSYTACTEVAAVGHNLAKFLGLDSLYAVGIFKAYSQDRNAGDYESYSHSFIILNRQKIVDFHLQQFDYDDDRNPKSSAPVVVDINGQTDLDESGVVTMIGNNFCTHNNNQVDVEYIAYSILAF